MFSIGSGARTTPRNRVAATFQNPIAIGADPWVTRHGEYYYWCLSEADLGVAVYRSRSLTTLGEKFVVWRAPKRGAYSSQVWAPELHRLDDRWYIYVAASNGRNETHRMIALESAGDDPTLPFTFKAELYTGDEFATRRKNRWAIDGTVLEHRGKRYFLWSGWADHRDDQSLYIAPMTNPWSLSAARVRLCANDDYTWERVSESTAERGLNEGPQILQRNGRVFVVYSCSGSWEPSYKLGMLELALDGDPLNPAAWHKQREPVFSPTAATCGVGHCSFTTSPDGAEDWIVFHAKVSALHGWDRRIRAQPFSWNDSHRPVFGAVHEGYVLARPSGDVGLEYIDPLSQARQLIQRVEVLNKSDERDGKPVTAQ
jgi:GH43 family beta-xylosidase